MLREFRSPSHLQIMAIRLKKNSPRLTHIFFDLINILDIPFKLDVHQMNLKKIYTSYVFLLKARVENIISTTNSPAIKKMEVVGVIFS